MRTEPITDSMVVTVARADGFDDFVVCEDGVELVASFRMLEGPARR